MACAPTVTRQIDAPAAATIAWLSTLEDLMRIHRPLAILFLSACAPPKSDTGVAEQPVYNSSCPTGPTATIDTSIVPTKTATTYNVNSSATLTSARARFNLARARRPT